MARTETVIQQPASPRRFLIWEEVQYEMGSTIVHSTNTLEGAIAWVRDMAQDPCREGNSFRVFDCDQRCFIWESHDRG